MKRSKPISFKTAFWIVVGLHVVAYVGMIQLSSIRYKISKAKWNEQMAKRNDMPSGDLWPEPNLQKKKVVAMPPTQKPKEQKQVTAASITIPQVIIPLKTVDPKPKITYTTPMQSQKPVVRSTSNGNRIIYKRQVDITEKAEQVITEFTQLISSNIVIQ